MSVVEIEDSSPSISEYPRIALSGSRWTPDHAQENCSLCRKIFKVTRRRHHCRKCGRVLCAKCSSSKITLQASLPPMRVCDLCNFLFSAPKTWMYFWKLADLVENVEANMQQLVVQAYRNSLVSDDNRRAFWDGGLLRVVHLVGNSPHFTVIEHGLAALVNFTCASEEFVVQLIRCDGYWAVIPHLRSPHATIQQHAARICYNLSRVVHTRAMLMQNGFIGVLTAAREGSNSAAEPFLLRAVANMCQEPSFSDQDVSVAAKCLSGCLKHADDRVLRSGVLGIAALAHVRPLIVGECIGRDGLALLVALIDPRHTEVPAGIARARVLPVHHGDDVLSAAMDIIASVIDNSETHTMLPESVVPCILFALSSAATYPLPVLTNASQAVLALAKSDGGRVALIAAAAVPALLDICELQKDGVVLARCTAAINTLVSSS